MRARGYIQCAEANTALRRRRALPYNRRRPSGFQARHAIDQIKRRAGIPSLMQKNSAQCGKKSRSGFQYSSVERLELRLNLLLEMRSCPSLPCCCISTDIKLCADLNENTAILARRGTVQRMLFNMPPFEKSRAANASVHYREQTSRPGLPSPAYIEILELHAGIRRTLKKTEHTEEKPRSEFQRRSVDPGPASSQVIVANRYDYQQITRPNSAATHRNHTVMCHSGQGFPQGAAQPRTLHEGPDSTIQSPPGY